jgi:hypothetical protein
MEISIFIGCYMFKFICHINLQYLFCLIAYNLRKITSVKIIYLGVSYLGSVFSCDEGVRLQDERWYVVLRERSPDVGVPGGTGAVDDADEQGRVIAPREQIGARSWAIPQNGHQFRKGVWQRGRVTTSIPHLQACNSQEDKGGRVKPIISFNQRRIESHFNELWF